MSQHSFPTALRIASVNTGQVAFLGDTPAGQPVYSGIRKAPLLGSTSHYVEFEGLAGDQQADERVIKGQRVHGGELKAVYAYPSVHYNWWATELGRVVVPGDFGENLTLDNVDERQVVIGEQWQWGEAVLEVTGPRRPCYKLDLLHGPYTARKMLIYGRCGWYYRVVRRGSVPTQGEMTLVSRPKDGITISQAFTEKLSRDSTIPGPPEDTK